MIGSTCTHCCVLIVSAACVHTVLARAIYQQEVHKAIREDPAPAEKQAFEPDRKYKKPVRRTYEERKAAVAEKKVRLAVVVICVLIPVCVRTI